MDWTDTVSFNCEQLLEKFEDRLNIVIGRCLENNFDKLLFAIGEIQEITQQLAEISPSLKSLEWFQSISKESALYLEKPLQKEQPVGSLLDSYLENIKHLVNYRHTDMIPTKNNRYIIEDMFSTAINISSLAQQLIRLANITENCAVEHGSQNKEVAFTLRKISRLALDCESTSLLSVEISWEVICCLIVELQAFEGISQSNFNQKFPQLEEVIINIETSLSDIYELLNVELQLNYCLKQANLKFRKRFNAGSIYAEYSDWNDKCDAMIARADNTKYN